MGLLTNLITTERTHETRQVLFAKLFQMGLNPRKDCAVEYVFGGAVALFSPDKRFDGYCLRVRKDDEPNHFLVETYRRVKGSRLFGFTNTPMKVMTLDQPFLLDLPTNNSSYIVVTEAKLYACLESAVRGFMAADHTLQLPLVRGGIGFNGGED